MNHCRDLSNVVEELKGLTKQLEEAWQHVQPPLHQLPTPNQTRRRLPAWEMELRFNIVSSQQRERLHTSRQKEAAALRARWDEIQERQRLLELSTRRT
jgi:hypothetical protein